MNRLISQHLTVLALLVVNSILVWSLATSTAADFVSGKTPLFQNNSGPETGHENSLAIEQLARQLSELSRSVRSLRATRVSPGSGQQELVGTMDTLELERLSTALERLQSNQESLRQQHADLAQSLSSYQPGSAFEAPLPAVAFDDTTLQQQTHERMKERIQELEYSLAAEPVDREFSLHVQDSLANELTATGVTTTPFVEAACSASNCRLDLDLSTFEEPARAFPDLMRMIPENAGGFVHTDENDPNQVAVYFERVVPYD